MSLPVSTPSEQEPIGLVRQRDWLIPETAQSYAVLRSLGVAETRIHADVFPTILDLLLKPNGIRGRVVGFEHTVLMPFLEKLADTWQNDVMFTCRLTKRELIFETTHRNALETARTRVQALQALLDRFFARWGFAHEGSLSESRGKLLYHVKYSISKTRLPVIALTAAAEVVVRPAILDLGFTRIEIGVHGKYVKFRLSLKAGDEFKVFKTGQCLLTDVKGVADFVKPLLPAAYAEADSTPVE